MCLFKIRRQIVLPLILCVIYLYLYIVQVWLCWLWSINRKGIKNNNPANILFAWFNAKTRIHSCALPDEQPTEYNTYADIEAVYECLERDYGTRPEEIVLYGQSVGSGPSLELAKRIPQLRGVVLHSPILSGIRVMYPVKHSYWFDIYKVSVFQCYLICVSFVFLGGEGVKRTLKYYEWWKFAKFHLVFNIIWGNCLH